LDRCSPKRALEVFESVKVFLDMEGFVFVMGLSHETIAKLIEAEYQTSGIKGAEYIRKIIQIPFLLPTWNESDSKDIIDNLLQRGQMDETYRQVIEDNKELISSVVEPVPREVKRFINSFLISYKIYSNIESIKPKELLLVQAIKFRWFDFYKFFSSDERFRNLIGVLLDFDFPTVSIIADDKEFERYESETRETIARRMDQEWAYRRKQMENKEGLRVVSSVDTQEEELQKYMKKFEDDLTAPNKKFIEASKTLRKEYKTAVVKLDKELWALLRNEKDTIFNIPNWEIYRRATEISKEIPTQTVREEMTIRYDKEGSEKMIV
jgi:KAP family P-loop domain